MDPLTRARRAFYTAGGPWYRARLAERLGSRRFSRPALHDLDRRLEPHLPPGPGVFVEAGAHDGFTQSNTYYLERFRGWRGLLVEPVPELHAKAAARRPRSHVAHAALVGPGFGAPTVTVRFGDLMSTLAEADPAHAAAGLETAGRAGYEVEVPARTLGALLDEAGLDRVDLLVLDVEGRELDALAGLDLERTAPGLVLLELLDLDAQRPAADAALGDRYAFTGALSPWDALYRRRA